MARDPFPPLQRSRRYGWWEGAISLPSLADCYVKWAWSPDGFYPSSRAEATLRSSVFLGVNDEKGHGPEAPQRAAMDYLVNDEAAVAAMLLGALKAELAKWLPDLTESHDWPPDEVAARDRFLKTLADGDGIRELVSLATITFYKRQLAGCSYTGFVFDKGWDWEHDSIVIMHKNRVVDHGDHGDLHNFEQDESYENEGDPVFED